MRKEELDKTKVITIFIDKLTSKTNFRELFPRELTFGKLPLRPADDWAGYGWVILGAG